MTEYPIRTPNPSLEVCWSKISNHTSPRWSKNKYAVIIYSIFIVFASKGKIGINKTTRLNFNTCYTFKRSRIQRIFSHTSINGMSSYGSSISPGANFLTPRKIYISNECVENSLLNDKKLV